MARTLAEPADYRRPSRPARLLMRAGLLSRDAMYWWWRNDFVNFGDWVGPLIYEARTGRKPIWRHPEGHGRGPYHVTAGSILAFGHSDREAIVWGSGIHNGVAEIGELGQVTALRGPMTRERVLACGNTASDVFGDPGLLVPRVLGLRPTPGATALGVVPHYFDIDRTRELFEGLPEVRIIDVRRSVQAVARDIAECGAVVSSSLHGVITAHALGLPTVWISVVDPGDRGYFKFFDYFAGLGVENVTGPVTVPDRETATELAREAFHRPAPDVQPLLDPLEAACPF